MRIILITQGLSRFLLPLMQSGHTVVGIIESMPRNFTKSKKDSLLYCLLKKIYSLFNKNYQTLQGFCEDRNIKYTHICEGRDKEVERWVGSIAPDLIVVFSMSQLLKESIFRKAKYGTINMHPSYLPEYRGANPDFWQYYDLEMNPGVTVHYVNEGEDTGDIIFQKRVHIPQGTKSPERLDKLITETGVPLMLQAIQAIKEGGAPRTPQPSKSPTDRARNLKVDEHATIIDWKKWPIERTWHVLRGTELWLNAVEQPSGLFKGQRWVIGDFERYSNQDQAGSIVKYKGRTAVAVPEGYIFLSINFSFKKAVLNSLKI